jgi:tRNA-dihydrouridine synthase
MLELYGPERGVILFRKHLVAYLRPYDNPKEIKKVLLTCQTAKELINLLNKTVF